MGGLQVTSTDAWSAELCTTDTAVGGPGNSTDNENKVITIQGQGQTKTRSSLYIGIVKKNPRSSLYTGIQVITKNSIDITVWRH